MHLLLVIPVSAALSCTATHTRAKVFPVLPTTQPAMARQIQNALDAGEGDYQLKVLRQRVAAEPDDLQARLELGEAYRVRGYPDMALEHFRFAAARFPDSGEAQLAVAKALRTARQYTQGINTLEAYLKKHSNAGAEYYSWLGILRDEAGLWPAGEAAHRAALERSPRRDYLHNNLGYNLMKQGKHAAAADEFREALKLNPNSAVARNNLGLALANTEKPDLAVKSLQAGTDPATAHSNMAAILIEQGRYVEARKELDIALGYNRVHPAALKNLELVSRLDGSSATIPGQEMETRWSRWKTTIRRLFVGPLDEPPKTAAKTAQLR